VLRHPDPLAVALGPVSRHEMGVVRASGNVAAREPDVTAAGPSPVAGLPDEACTGRRGNRFVARRRDRRITLRLRGAGSCGSRCGHACQAEQAQLPDHAAPIHGRPVVWALRVCRMFGHRFSFDLGWSNGLTKHQARGQTMTVMITARYSFRRCCDGARARNYAGSCIDWNPTDERKCPWLPFAETARIAVDGGLGVFWNQLTGPDVDRADASAPSTPEPHFKAPPSRVGGGAGLSD
jgi:hypothetical protein